MVSLTSSSDQLLVQIPILLMYVLQEPLSLCSVHTLQVPVDTDKYLEKNYDYTQMHIQYPYIAMLYDSYVSLTKPQLNLCLYMEVVY